MKHMSPGPLLGLILLAAGLPGAGPADVDAQQVTLLAVLGTDHNLGAAEVGEVLTSRGPVRAGPGTIVVLVASWGGCHDWLIIHGSEGRFGTTAPDPCRSERTAPEIWEDASAGRHIAQHALALASSDPKADNPFPRWVGEFQAELRRRNQAADETTPVRPTRPELDRRNQAAEETAPVLPSGTYTIQQARNRQYVDAHESAGMDFGLVTRPPQNNTSQRWILRHTDNNTYTMQQASNQRFVDAHESAENDFHLVTRPYQSNPTQLWRLTGVGRDTYTIQQVSTGRYVDAHEGANNDFRLVTRPRQADGTQHWIIIRR